MEQARQEAPKVQFGSYVLHDRIGAGGMAEIFLATSPTAQGIEKELVIKRILPSLSGDDQFVKMFVEEARLCVNLRHPNIVQVYDLGEVGAQFFIAMEYVHGRDLLKTLAACAKKRMGFPTDIALYIVMEVLKGLDYAHNLRGPDGAPLGIIHRDVSPSNVLLSFDGKVKLGDFGIAKASSRERTATGILKGKFGYMAPEQVIGRAIDHRADVFAVGILLYELLTGHRLFAGRNDLAVLERVRDAVVDPPPRFYNPDLSRDLESIVLRALSREAKDRFQSTSELHEALYNYTFKRGVVVTSRTLSRFLHELFLTEETEEHYGATAAKEKAKNSLAPPELGKRSAPPRPATSRERPRLDLMPGQEDGLAPPTFEDESTDSPAQFDDDPTTQHQPGPEMLPFPGAERAKASFVIPDEGPSSDAMEEVEEGSGQTDILDFPSGRPLLDPAELAEAAPSGSGAVPAARRVALEPVEPRRPASEVRAIRKQKTENSETELDLEDQKADEPVEEVSTFTPYGGVPVVAMSTPETASVETSETLDAEDGRDRVGPGLVEAVRRAMDPTEPVESVDDEAERTDLLDQAAVSAVIAAPAVAAPSATIRAHGVDEELEEAIDFVELAPEATGDTRTASDGVALTSQEVESPGDWVEHTRDEQTSAGMAGVPEPTTIEGPAQERFLETTAAQVVDRVTSGTTAGSEWGQEVSVLRAEALVTTGTLRARREPSAATPAEGSAAIPSAQGFERVPSVIAREWNAIVEHAEKSASLRDPELVTDSIAHPDALDGATEDIPLKPPPAPMPVVSDDIPSVRPRRGTGPKGKIPAATTKPLEVRSPFSIVGRKSEPPPDETRLGLLAPALGELDDPDEVSDGQTRMGALARAASENVISAPGARRMSSGVTAALSEAALADEEIQAIRAESKAGPLAEDTSNGPMIRNAPRSQSPAAPVAEPLDEEAEETVNGPHPADELPRAKVPKVSESFSRLEDSGASGLFGALKLLDEEPADLGGEMRSFAPDEEASLDTTAGHTGDDFAPRGAPEIAAPSVLRTSQEMMVAPSVAAAMKKSTPARGPERTGVGAVPMPDFRDPAEEPSGIVVRFEKFEEPTDSVKETAPERGRGVRILEGDEDSVSSAAESPDIVSERPDVRAVSSPVERLSSVRPPIRAPSLALNTSESYEETPHSLKFAKESLDQSMAGLEDELRGLISSGPKPKEPVPVSQERGVYGSKGPELVSDDLEFGPEGPRSGGNPVVNRPSASPKEKARGSSPPSGETNAEAERRMRAMVERMRPAKEKQRTQERLAERPSADPASPTGPIAGPTPRQSVGPETGRVSQTPPQQRPTIPPQVAAGPIPSSRVAEMQITPAQGISLRTSLIVFFFALVFVALAVLTAALTHPRSAKPIPPVTNVPLERTVTDVVPPPASPSPPPAEVAEREAPKTAPEETAGRAEAEPARAPEAAPAKSPEAPPARAAEPAPSPEPAREAEPAPRRAEPAREAEPAPRRAEEAPPARSAKPRAAAESRPKPEPKPKAEKAEPKPLPKPEVSEPKKAEAAPKPTRPEPKVKLPSNIGALKLSCAQPATVTIIPSGTYTDVTTKEFRLAPGAYRVMIKRADGSTAQSFLRVVGGESQTVPCDH